MQPQEYIQQELEKLKEFHPRKVEKEVLADEIFRLLMSKKFRKYSAKPELITHIKNAIRICIDEQKPINLTFLHGAYKLWRLEEAPLPDWGELFSAMYYTEWVKPICEIYQPGVWWDYFLDDLIVSRIDNIPLENIDLYIQSYQKILDFLKAYQPKNLTMTITRVGNQFASTEEFNASVAKNMKKLSEEGHSVSER